MTGGWEFWIDRGGTFTDVVARDTTGRLHVQKLLSDDPEHYPDAPLHAIRSLLGLSPGAPIPSDRIKSVKLGTTLATNALLERKGARVGLLVTKGFGDLLEIGYQDRPRIFEFNIRKPSPLVARTIEIDERVLADGSVRKPLDEKEVRAALETLRHEDIDSLAVLFLHSYAYPEHELTVEQWAVKAGFSQISLSHRVAREIKAVGRGDTTVADAYLTPILREYVGRLRGELGPGVALRFMQSNGGLTDADQFSGKNAILSGPAGGVVAYAHVCKLAGIDKAIGFDMGGTSTDVSRFDGRFERSFETRVGGIRLKAPMMHIETVAAGGGSVLQFDGRRCLVGPESAGADPGPACYRRGGPATVTDANLVLGRIQPKYFPACFGPNADQPLDTEASRARLQELANEIAQATGEQPTVEAVAAGFVRVANENMAKPIKTISVARGYDPRDHALACFGAAGAQHACALAESLGIRTIVLHPLAGVLSAYGIGLADVIHADVEAVLELLGEKALENIGPRFVALEARNAEVLAQEGLGRERIEHLRSLDLRYRGVDAYLNVEYRPGTDLRAAFEEEHRRLYGFIKPGHDVEIVNLRVESIGRTDKPPEPEAPETRRVIGRDSAIDFVTVYFPEGAGGVRETTTAVYRRADLRRGDTFDGPAIIVEDISTIVVDPGWSAEVDRFGHILLCFRGAGASERTSTECDPVMLEIFNNLFMSVAEQMGKTLERVSHSVNIKERLDFSCAVFSGDGDLVANAPHLPVHLGAMGESVKAVLAECGEDMRPGDVYVTNDPYHGGSHLPDVTVVSPVFTSGGQPAFFVANRGHHADIGGILPGSMPPFSRSIDEEGVVIHNFRLVSGGRFHEEEMVRLLTEHPYPARNIEERLSDLRAQVAANAAGIRLMNELCERYGPEVVEAYMGHVRANAAAAMRDMLAKLPDGEYRAEDFLDDGARIACAITVRGNEAIVDFAETDAQLAGNLNAPRAVTVAAVLYVFRCLINAPIPLNAGCLDPITIRVPAGSLLDPRPPAAVVGGNVETSNRIVDVLCAALGCVAGSQGTMNNFTFGTSDWGYYETICGGAGAGPGFHGASAVHTHMTNTRITDPEVLERRYPVLLREFSIRRGSGGGGTYRGGDGVVRAVEFRSAMSAGILSERRIRGPYGLNGAGRGKPGRNRLVRGGVMENLPGHAALEVKPGDVIVIETPGGGGYNPAHR